MHQGLISPTFYEQLLHAQVPKAQKIQSSHQSFFALFGSVRVKSVRKMLVQSIPDVYHRFLHILVVFHIIASNADN